MVRVAEGALSTSRSPPLCSLSLRLSTGTEGEPYRRGGALLVFITGCVIVCGRFGESEQLSEATVAAWGAEEKAH